MVYTHQVFAHWLGMAGVNAVPLIYLALDGELMIVWGWPMLYVCKIAARWNGYVQLCRLSFNEQNRYCSLESSNSGGNASFLCVFDAHIQCILCTQKLGVDRCDGLNR